MAPTNKPKFQRIQDLENQLILTTKIVDISTAQSVFIASPVAGDITNIQTCLEGAITGADAVITVEIETVLVTGSSITVANSGSAAGDVDSAAPTALNTVAVGDAIEIITSGASTGAQELGITLTIDINTNV